jgi:hypothetical protein
MYAEWQVAHGKDTTNRTETAIRFPIFKAKVIEVINFNREKKSWRKGINAYSDLTNEEFKKMYPPIEDDSVYKDSDGNDFIPWDLS